jgi:aromatic ring-opening dioxygenase catalytic subunit (LigB family)
LAADNDTWTADTISRNDIDNLIDWQKKAPGSNIAHPDDGAHFNVMMFVLGAAVRRGSGLSWSRTMHEDFGSSTFSERGFLFA